MKGFDMSLGFIEKITFYSYNLNVIKTIFQFCDKIL
jgi:hypothetical protein